MKMGIWATLLLAAAPLLAGCGNFWQAPNNGSSTSFTLSSANNITVTPGATSGNTSVISVTPADSFTGTVTLACTVSSPTSATNPTTCSLSPTSVSITDTTVQTSTLTATTGASTTLGNYQVTVTGTSGSVSETTTVCVTVGSSSGSCSTAGTSGNFYVLNQTTSQVVAMNIASGQVTTIASYTLPTAGALAIAIAPNGSFLYVSTVNGIYLYTIDTSDGALTLGNSGQPISSDPAYTMQVDSTNSWLVEAVTGTTELFAVAIDSSSGGLATAGETEQTFAGGLPASTPMQLAISPNDSSSCTDCYVFVAMGPGGTEAIHFNPGNANPFGTFGNPGVLHSPGGDNTVAVDPTNRLLYVGESNALPSATQTGGLRVFTIGDTGVTEISGSPYAIGGTGPSGIRPTSDGNYVYVANEAVSGSSTGNIAGFSVATTALTSMGTVAAGPTGQMGLAEDSSGSYILAVDFAGNPDLEAYTLSTGTLTSTLTSTTGNDPVGAIAIAAAPK